MTELQINKDFVLRKVCGVNVVLPAGLKVKDFGGALNLKSQGLWWCTESQRYRCADFRAVAGRQDRRGSGCRSHGGV